MWERTIRQTLCTGRRQCGVCNEAQPGRGGPTKSQGGWAQQNPSKRKWYSHHTWDKHRKLKHQGPESAGDSGTGMQRETEAAKGQPTTCPSPSEK